MFVAETLVIPLTELKEAKKVDKALLKKLCKGSADQPASVGFDGGRTMPRRRAFQKSSIVYGIDHHSKFNWRYEILLHRQRAIIARALSYLRRRFVS